MQSVSDEPTYLRTDGQKEFYRHLRCLKSRLYYLNGLVGSLVLAMTVVALLIAVVVVVVAGLVGIHLVFNVISSI